jgi:3-deoxy-D-manno-octulosonic-acid transferase
MKKKIFLKDKLFLPKLDEPLTKEVVWVHAVSLGEMKAIVTLIEALKEVFDFSLVITTQTTTGYAFAKNRFKKNVYYLPLDFPYLQSRLINLFSPKIFLLMESDFWFNQLSFLKRSGALAILLNGKMSDRSFKRFQFFSFFSRSLFSYFSALFVQDQDAMTKYGKFVPIDKIFITGNLKLSKKGNLESTDRVRKEKSIVIACTHPDEEIELFFALKELLQKGWKLYVAPRHPERFDPVYFALKALYPSIERLSTGGESNCVFVDQMGVLDHLYAKSLFCVMGGSYSSKQGGHDIFEPILNGAYTIFGPYMQSQKQLKQLAQDYGLGEECAKERISQRIESLVEDMATQQEFKKNLEEFKSASKSGFETVFQQLKKIFSEKKIKKNCVK